MRLTPRCRDRGSSAYFRTDVLVEPGRGGQSEAGVTALTERLRGALSQPVRDRDRVATSPAVTELADLSMLGGHWFDGPRGRGYLIESEYDAGYRHGAVPLFRALTASTAALAAQCHDARIADCAPEDFLFIDTETTGMGGAGSMVFLAAAARFESGMLRLRQFFLPTPEYEPGMLGGLTGELERSTTLVSYNGKSFDVPALESRAVMSRMPLELRGKAHVDLLHPNRRLFKGRMASHRLIDAEVELLGFVRKDDCPSAEVPARYFEFQRSGDPTHIAPVLRHNAWDVLSLVALFARMAEACESDDEPLQAGRAADYAGDHGIAYRSYELALAGGGLSRPERLEVMERLARCAARAGDSPLAARWWRALVEESRNRRLVPYVELAKLQEHRERDFGAALTTVRAAWTLLQQGLVMPGAAHSETCVDALRRRIERLEGKSARGLARPGRIGKAPDRSAR